MINVKDIIQFFKEENKNDEILKLKEMIIQLKNQNESLHEENKKLRNFILDIHSDIDKLFDNK